MVSTYDKGSSLPFRLDCTILCNSIVWGKSIRIERKSSLEGFLLEVMKEEISFENSPVKMTFSLQAGVLFFTSIEGSTFNGVKCHKENIGQNDQTYVCTYEWKENRDKIIEHRNSNNSLVKKFSYDENQEQVLSGQDQSDSGSEKEQSRLVPVEIKHSKRLISLIFVLRRHSSAEKNQEMIKEVETLIFSDICKQFAKSIRFLFVQSVDCGEPNYLPEMKVEYKDLCNPKKRRNMREKLQDYYVTRKDIHVSSGVMEYDRVVRNHLGLQFQEKLPEKRKNRIFIFDLCSPFEISVYQRFVDQLKDIEEKKLQLKVKLFYSKSCEKKLEEEINSGKMNLTDLPFNGEAL